jgi:hypothetical protein
MEVAVMWEERYWYPDDGGIVWLAGYSVVDPGTGRFLARDAPELAAAGLRIAGRRGRRPPSRGGARVGRRRAGPRPAPAP